MFYDNTCVSPVKTYLSVTVGLTSLPPIHFDGGTIRIFSFCAPSTLRSPQLQSTCHYIVNDYVKILHVRLGDANNMHP